MKPEKIMDMLSKMACDVELFGNVQIAAAIVIKNEIISFGVNEHKTHPFQKKYAPNPMALYKHAENAAIINALNRVPKNDLKKATMYIVRVKKDHSWGMACPCEGCSKAIKEYGIKKVVYTTDVTNQFECKAA
ncbi:MAG: deaminase [Legionella sp.]|uniref:deaminase n=1 Tax=Legionella sp. TaxID=459 RepID=UPI00284F8DFA|nr:deaminase [Legionella sp.]